MWDTVWDTKLEGLKLADAKVTLRVKDRGAGPRIYARWRDADGQVERPVGMGWLVRIGEPGAKPNGKTIAGWRERKGRPQDGFLTVDAARERVPEIVAAYVAEQRAQARRVAQADRPTKTVTEVAEAWIAWRSEDDPSGAHEAWKHATRKNNANTARRLAREIGDDRPAGSVSAEELHELIATGLQPMRNGKPIEGRETTRKMRATYAAAARGMFAYAQQRGWIEQDPAADLPAYRGRKKRAGDPLRRDEYLTPDELRAIVAELRKGAPEEARRTQLSRDQDAAMTLLMGMAGLRPGEAIALRWEDVDFTRALVRVVWSRTMGVTDTPKSHAGRITPMADEVSQALAALGLRDHYTAPQDRVFGSADGAHVDLSGFRDRFHAAQDRAKVTPRRDVRQLRNTFGTVCASEGVPLRTIQEWMGHESITTTEIYASFMPRHEDAAIVSRAFGRA